MTFTRTSGTISAMQTKNIRNFSIIAHIDHGKSTLADRMLEITGTVPERKMKEQVLDSMELERERGITIKMQPVRMEYESGGQQYVLNLIDTPGHIDFSYEVSRSMNAVEGALLLVDSTQGVQAQTFSTLHAAQELGLTIIPVLSKVDSPLSRVSEIKQEVVKLLDCKEEDILEASGKTGQGVKELLEVILKKIPAPKEPASSELRALVFDFQYSNHKGIIVYTRVYDGVAKKNNRLLFRVGKEKFSALETGIFSPDETPKESLGAGEIGYIVTGIKKPGVVSVGDTIVEDGSSTKPLPGYMQPRPVIWASIFPESQDEFNNLRQALLKLKLSDASLSYEEESSLSLGRGFRCGFLGMLHLEIVTERLRREYNLELIVTTPTVFYEIQYEDGKVETVYSPQQFPEYGESVTVYEPWVKVTIITPKEYLSPLMQLLFEHEAEIGDSKNFGDERISLESTMPLRELMRNFFDKLKNVSSGFASIAYEIIETKKADVVRLDVLVAEEIVPAFSKIISRRRVEEESKQIVSRLYDNIPRQMFTTKIQAQALGRIVSSKTLSALKKDVTGHLYGGDITRKRKLWEKQKKGKKKMKERGKVNIPHDVFLKIVKME